MEYQKILRQLYNDFNDRNIDAVLAHLHRDVIWPNGWEGGSVCGHDQVRAYWIRQWQEIDPVVRPVSFQERLSENIAVGVHQLIKDLDGQVLSDSQIIHVYSFGEGKIKTMVIEQI